MYKDAGLATWHRLCLSKKQMNSSGPGWRVVKHEKQGDSVLDLRGWSCPWCILKVTSCLRKMHPGQILEVLSTDPRVQTNFPQILKRGRNRVIDLEENGDFLRLFIKRG